jgi:CubicO group peptidase (beta-lactamase class C family)
MSTPRLWAWVFALPVAVAAANVSRGLPLFLIVPAVVAAAAAWRSRYGIVYACMLIASGWATAVGPWSGNTRFAVGAAIGAISAAGLTVLRPRGRRAAAIAAALLVLGSTFVQRNPPTVGSPGTTSELQRLDYYLESQVSDGQIPGVAAAVVKDGRIVFSRGYGTAGSDRRMTPETAVVIGSTSKSITALATLQLVDDGHVDLDAPIGRYLPWFDPDDARAEAITVRDLLIDTSGVPTWAGWSALAGDGRADEGSIRDLVNNLQLLDEPGGRFRYSNANYIILGEIIEAASGRPYAEVVKGSIFEPLDMEHTTAGAPAGTVANRYWLGLPMPSHLPYLEIGIPAGAVSSSASDLAVYLQAQLGDHRSETLNDATRTLLHEPAVEAEGFGVPDGRQYAMGWYVGPVVGEPAVFHSGDVFDSSSSLVMLPERDLGVVVVSTTSSPLVPTSKTLAEGIVAELLDERPPELHMSMALATVALLAVAAAILAFAVTRARSLAIAPRVTGRLSLLRLTVLDLLVPTAALFGLPFLFSTQLDRAEMLTASSFWRLVIRGVPDAGTIVVGALILRFALGGFAATQRLVEKVRARRPDQLAHTLAGPAARP